MVIRHDAPELQLGFMQLEREGSPPPGLRLPQAKLSRKSNQVARGRIRRFESCMPSHAVVSNRRSAKEKLRPEGSAEDCSFPQTAKSVSQALMSDRGELSSSAIIF